MKKITVFLAGLLFSFLSFSGLNDYAQSSQTDTIIKEDSMNLATFRLDFETYDFKSVNVSYYSRCDNNCDIDSLPIRMYFDSWWDYAHVYFYYKYDNSLLFQGGITWMGMGNISYPETFTPAIHFSYISSAIPLPADAEYYNTTIIGNYCTWDQYKQRAGRAWHAIDSLQITNTFAEKPFRVGLYGYSRTEGPFNPSVAEWIIFLYRGNTLPASTGTISGDPGFKLLPNPSTGIFYFPAEVNPQTIEVFSLSGVRLARIDDDHSNHIDLSNLPDGYYLVKTIYQSGVQYSKVSIRH